MRRLAARRAARSHMNSSSRDARAILGPWRRTLTGTGPTGRIRSTARRYIAHSLGSRRTSAWRPQRRGPQRRFPRRPRARRVHPHRMVPVCARVPRVTARAALAPAAPTGARRHCAISDARCSQPLSGAARSPPETAEIVESERFTVSGALTNLDSGALGGRTAPRRRFRSGRSSAVEIGFTVATHEPQERGAARRPECVA
jgi:hypothetical protein